jgi:transcriptional regulator with GAF, ATPase, and Fis domain
MPEITTTLGTARSGWIQIRRGRFTCVSGKDAGRSWLVDRDVVRIGTQADNDIQVADGSVSCHHAEVLRTREGVLLKDIGSANGTFVGALKVREVYLAPDTRFRVGHTELLYSPAEKMAEVLPSREERFEDMVGSSVVMHELFAVLERVAPTDLTVLVTGETGTGKELASRAIHRRSRRAQGPFVVFDCGAVSHGLLESELFGHERGAFTGAVASRPGVFESADGGTVLMDEIGELPLDLQPRFLRVLEQREVRRVGSGRTRNVNVRIVAATNRNLREEVKAGRFREDLYYRLAVVEVELPPLRRRLADVPLLVDHVLRRSGNNPGVEAVSPEVLELFRTYAWPGNVRELSNVVERTLPFSHGPVLSLESLPESLRAVPIAPRLEAVPPSFEGMTPLPLKAAKEHLIFAFETRYLLDLLDRHHGNVSLAARAAGMDRKSISRLLKKHGIRK